MSAIHSFVVMLTTLNSLSLAIIALLMFWRKHVPNLLLGGA